LDTWRFSDWAIKAYGISTDEPAKRDLMACAYELVPIDFERRAWVSTVMSGKPMEAYFGSWLPDGFY
jgi:hypothetical protein